MSVSVNTNSAGQLRAQRLKEAVWRIQGHVRKGCRAGYRIRMIEDELAMLAKELGVEMLP